MIIILLDKLSDQPTPKNTKLLLILGIVLLVIFSALMQYFEGFANYPVSFIESQLSFSGAKIKNWFRMMSSEELEYYTLVQALDYGFMAGFGLIIFDLTLIIARKFDEESGWRKSGYIVAVLGILAACFDGIENAFIFLMLSDPSGFPDIWAIAHSCFALVKLIIYFLIFTIWTISAVITIAVKK